MSNDRLQLLPFQFSRFDDDDYLLVNESGEYIFMGNEEFGKLMQGKLTREAHSYYNLKSRHFINTEHLAETLEMVSAKYRTRKRFISDFTSLHMMVLTLRCTNQCKYCQVRAEGDYAKGFDMSPEVAYRVVDYIFNTPSPSIKIEFQGGEPTLNWKTLEETVLYAKKLNRKCQKQLSFVVCTNLVKVNKRQLMFFKKHGINISTSLDGPRDIHDQNRITVDGKGTYDAVIRNINNISNILCRNDVSALMTTTINNIDNLQDVIMEYVNLGLDGIFIRSLNPYGFAAIKLKHLGYSVEHFVENFEKALNFIIQLNLNGTRFVEYYTSLLLARILTPFATGFVDLQSPSGAGISGAIYDHNGDVYPADEARMLSRMGDRRFFLGNVFKDPYEVIFGGDILREIVSKSCVEVMPYCSSCVYRTYCGSDPIRNYLETGDIIGRRPNDFCKKNKLMFNLLFKILKRNDPKEMDVFWSWITCRSLKEIRGDEACNSLMARQ